MTENELVRTLLSTSHLTELLVLFLVTIVAGGLLAGSLYLKHRRQERLLPSDNFLDKTID